jgi:hypothetical protein|tara:strand:+ start:1682 stop:1900 length:219 start_codon:yes stop_codon:yes gene_type:complete
MTHRAIWFADEAPRIGSGYRIVNVKKRGRKWVYLEYWPGGSEGHKINVRLRKSVFERLEELTDHQLKIGGTD